MDYVSILKESFENPFNINSYRNFIVNFLKGSELKPINGLRSAEIFAEFSYYVQGFALVAEYTSPKREKVGVYAVKLKAGRDIEKARSKQRNFIARLIKDNDYAAAIVAFYLDEETKWRLSFVRMDYEFVKGKVASNLTPAKRYSYLVGKNEPCHTAQESLLPIFAEEDFSPTVDSIEKAFSVEKVTKQFFEKYKEKYLQLKEYLLSNEAFRSEAMRCMRSEDETQIEKFSEQFSKKFMGQLVFLYFLQKKGWLGVKALKPEISEKEYKDIYYYNSVTREFAPRVYNKIAENVYKLNANEVRALTSKQEEMLATCVKGNAWGTGSRTFVRDLFEIANKSNENFFDDYLEPLFYEGLNQERKADNYYARLHCRIPFLNGGLFEPLDNYDWENNAFSIPNSLFSNKDEKGREADGILDVFDRYNFTMNEDEPLEKEVAVDPEMLGKIFENLLDVKDRKSKGAFYTPREIVHYMCQESLINYIVNTIGTPYEDTKDFVVYGEIMKDEDCSRESTYGLNPTLLMPDSIYNNLKEIDEALADVRVADPAVGSGAFPMGMLSEIVKLREIITEYLAREICLKPEYKDSYKDERLKARMRAEIWKLRNETRNTYKLKKETMRNSIYAVDIEPSAVDIAKLRLWLTLVVEQEIDPNDPENRSPLTLPNLDCNIMCGNSLIDEFEGIDLSFDGIISNEETQEISIWDKNVEIDYEKLFIAQRDYFYASKHEQKYELRERIFSLKQAIIDKTIEGIPADKKARFEEACNEHSTPFFLWKLNFAKVFKEKGGFDIVIGNPPYIDSETMMNSGLSKEREFIARKYSFAKGNWDIYIAFFELGFKLSKGCLIYITPDKWVSKSFGDAMRKVVVNNIFSILEAGRDIFDSAKVDSIVTLISKRIYNFIDVYRINDKKFIYKDKSVSKSILTDPFSLDIIFSKNLSVYEKICECREKKLSNIAICENACATSDCYTLKTILFSLNSESEFNEATHLKVINTGTIGRFYAKWGKSDMRYLKDKYAFPVVDKKAFLELFPNSYGVKSIKPKIIIKGLTLLDSCIDKNGLIIPGKSTMMISSDEDNLFFLMAFLNSKLPLFYIKQKYASSSYNGGINFSKDMINDLPISKKLLDRKEELVLLAKAIYNNQNNNYCDNRDSIEDEIDDIVFNCYNLSAEQIALVEESVK